MYLVDIANRRGSFIGKVKSSLIISYTYTLAEGHLFVNIAKSRFEHYLYDISIAKRSIVGKFKFGAGSFHEGDFFVRKGCMFFPTVLDSVFIRNGLLTR